MLAARPILSAPSFLNYVNDSHSAIRLDRSYPLLCSPCGARAQLDGGCRRVASYNGGSRRDAFERLGLAGNCWKSARTPARRRLVSA